MTELIIFCLKIIAGLILFASILAAFIGCYLSFKNHARLDRHRKELNRLHDNFQTIITNLNSTEAPVPAKPNTPKDSKRVSQTRNQNTRAENVANRNINLKKTTPDAPRQIFLGMPSRMSETEFYFPCEYQTGADTDVRFEATITNAPNNTLAEFQPINRPDTFNEMRTSDQILKIIDYSGCAPARATQMRIIRSGKIRKDNGDHWKIEQKPQIHFE